VFILDGWNGADGSPAPDNGKPPTPVPAPDGTSGGPWGWNGGDGTPGTRGTDGGPHGGYGTPGGNARALWINAVLYQGNWNKKWVSGIGGRGGAGGAAPTPGGDGGRGGNGGPGWGLSPGGTGAS